MKVEVLLPEFEDEDMEEATISQWCCDEGEHVEKGEDLVEIAFDENTHTLPAPVAGILIEIKADNGAAVKVGGTIAILDTEDVDDDLDDDDEEDEDEDDDEKK
ncbi:MAG: lipoyl domain-containing protein [Planctomycetota bacterium]